MTENCRQRKSFLRRIKSRMSKALAFLAKGISRARARNVKDSGSEYGLPRELPIPPDVDLGFIFRSRTRHCAKLRSSYLLFRKHRMLKSLSFDSLPSFSFPPSRFPSLAISCVSLFFRYSPTYSNAFPDTLALAKASCSST